VHTSTANAIYIIRWVVDSKARYYPTPSLEGQLLQKTTWCSGSCENLWGQFYTTDCEVII